MFITTLPNSIKLEDWDWQIVDTDEHGCRLWERWELPYTGPAAIGEITRHPSGTYIWYDHPRHRKPGEAKPVTVDTYALLAEICMNLPITASPDTTGSSR